MYVCILCYGAARLLCEGTGTEQNSRRGDDNDNNNDNNDTNSNNNNNNNMCVLPSLLAVVL